MVLDSLSSGSVAREIKSMSEHVGGPRFRYSSEVLRGEGKSEMSFGVWGRKIRHAEERLKVLIDDFYLVREEIILGPFPTHLGGTRLGSTRLGGTRVTCHSAFMVKPSTT
jgi:hypothetical protein